ncbi:MAG: hypothetical protein LBB45_07895 [Methanobrevibacter sp.]|jgi:hypothetical protein|nr:hypothetical protein [Candidatus Methanovirga basalitermitum]
MVNINNKTDGSHTKDYSSAKIQISKDKSNKDKFSKYQSPPKPYTNKRHDNGHSQSNQYQNHRLQSDQADKMPKNHKFNNSYVNDLKNEIRTLKTQIDEQKKESMIEISDLKKKIFRLHNEKSKLSKSVEVNEVKEVDHKLKNVEKLKQDLLKSQHKNTVIKDILDETRENVDALKMDNENLIAIIEDFGNLGLIDSLKRKKPDSYYKFFKNSQNLN